MSNRKQRRFLKRWAKKFSPYLKRCGERIISISAFYFPFAEVASYFGPKVFLNTDSVPMRMFYSTRIERLSRFYTDNNLLIFLFMVWLFIVCVRGSQSGNFPLTKYVRYNVIQAILLNIVCSCSGVIFTYLPIVLRETMVGLVFANYFFVGIVLTILYSSLLIAYGRFPKIPVLSDAAKLSMQVHR